MRAVLAVAVLAAAAGCHVTTRTELTRARPTPHTVTHPDQARPQPATIVVSDGGSLRFVDPLMCPSELIVDVEPEIQRVRRPNLATFVVGVIATAAGAISAISAGSGKDPGGNPLTYAGVGLAVAGLPFAIGPWFGNRVDTEAGPPRTERRPGADVPCGERAIGGGTAILTIGERRVFGAVGADGRFVESPFEWVDAFDPTGGEAFAIHAELGDGVVIEKVIEAGALAPYRDGFLAKTHLDLAVEPLRAVPHIGAGIVRIGRVLFGGQPVLHVTLQLTNTGPGEAWQVRARVGALSPELDGRIVYVGHVPPMGQATGELWVALSPEARDALPPGKAVDLAFGLADANRTMAADPLRYRGTVHDDGAQ